MSKRKVILYIAQSLDGYIANTDGSLDWLPQDMGNGRLADFYGTLMERIDTVAMGRHTYDHIVTELSPNTWPYPNQKSYVWTTKSLSHPDCIGIQENLPTFIKNFHTEQGKDLWIVGGANFAQEWIKQDFIDEYIINIVPIILGEGIPLFKKINFRINLELIDTISEMGITQLHYLKK